MIRSKQRAMGLTVVIIALVMVVIFALKLSQTPTPKQQPVTAKQQNFPEPPLGIPAKAGIQVLMPKSPSPQKSKKIDKELGRPGTLDLIPEFPGLTTTDDSCSPKKTEPCDSPAALNNQPQSFP